MDLLNVDTFVQPKTWEEVPAWQPGWAWLAGGTWLFSEPQPNLKTLVDLNQFGWSELEVSSRGIIIGATCPMVKLLELETSADWPGVSILKQAVHELASFKVQGSATVVGNICLALPASTFAPVMVLLGAQYEILSPDGGSRWIPAQAFQTAARHTLLRPGEVMRRIHIPPDWLSWQADYRRLCLASAGIAVTIVVAARNPVTAALRYAIGGAIPAPILLEIAATDEVESALEAAIAPTTWLNNVTGSAPYRRAMTAVLMRRCAHTL